MSVPAVPTLTRIPMPKVSERTLGNGLRVIAVRRTGAPMVEARLRMKLGGATSPSPAERARRRLWGKTLLAGTSARDLMKIASDLQRMGGSLGGGADSEEAAVGGSVLAPYLKEFLGLMAEVLTDSVFPAAEVGLERERALHEIVLSRSQPTTVARLALDRRVYGTHPYAAGLPTPEAMAGVTPAALRKYASTRVGPAAGVLVLVGDLKPAAALDAAEAALGPDTWTSAAEPTATPKPPPVAWGPIELVDRPGAVQSNLRLAGPARPRTDPAFPALSIANLIYGGYFSSRLVANIREDKGYTYSPRSGIEHNLAGSLLTISADVATEVTAAALHEIAYEQGRMATGPVAPDELEAAKRYLLGSVVLSIQPQAGLAGYLAGLALHGIGLDYLQHLPGRVNKVTADDVQQAAAEHLGASRMATVVVGDASQVQGPLGALAPVEVVESP